MLEYFPWSEKVFEETISDYRNNRLPILDLELGGECNCNCLYCDSPNRSAHIEYPVASVSKMLESGHFKWLYVCGLGEPTFERNLGVLEELLNVCDSHNIKCSIFTNALNITSTIKRFIDKGVLHLLFKYDSPDDDVNSILLGRKLPIKYNDIFSEIQKSVKIEGEYTNIAASIVPTIYNESVIDVLAQKCINSNIFPLIGALEIAGNAAEKYEKLAPRTEKLLTAKTFVDQMFRGHYRIPMCPSTIGAIHVAANGDIVVDTLSGLSCSWFWLDPPNTISLGNINQEFNYHDVVKKIIDYRKEVLSNLKLLEKRYPNGPFGGCGGNIQELLFTYINIMEQN